MWIGIATIALLVGVAGFMIAGGGDSPASAAKQDAPVAADAQETPAATDAQEAPAAAEALPPEIEVDEAYNLYQNGAFVLDIRTPGEWDEYHAPNTTLIPLDELEARVNEVPRDKQVVLVCRSGNRSQVARGILEQAGFDNTTSMRGGLKAWRSAGYPIE
ncbi:MAG: hypothetical protein B6243_01305 [Anaerolineaceae bacterium 4572_5.2]|nr:MAG: hypothetical protein B6243_01305 [Anaerolineaceae bacterium 4572_5.2]